MTGETNKNTFLIYSAILCITVGICYLRALDCGFCFDDISAIVDNKDLRARTPVSNLFWNDFWGTPMHKEKSHKSYRPLCVLTFRFNYWWNELEPMSYHLTNVVLHALVCVMFMKTCCMFLHELPSFIAGLLFAVHPIHTEAVTGVVGRAESLSSIFFLASLMLYSRCTGYHKNIVWPPLLMAICLVTVAMLCKEQGITVIGVCVVYELFVAQRALFKDLWAILMGILVGKPKIPKWLQGSIVRSGVLVGSTLFLLIARIKVMGAQLPVFTKFDNPASVSPTPARQMTYNYLLPINFWLLLFPADLCCDWTMGTIPVIKSIIDYRNLITLAFYIVLGKIVYFALCKQGRVNRALIMCLALLVLPFIPASNLFFPVGFVAAERILYTPSMGFCMFIALGFDVLLQYKKSLKSLLWLLMGVLVVSHSGKTYLRNIDWTSEYTIFRAALTVNQKNAKLWNNVGHALESKQKYLEALDYFNKAVSVQPDDIGAHMNVGRTYNNMEMYEEAEAAYNKAKEYFPAVIPGKAYTARVAPNHLNIFLNLARLASRNPARLEEAAALLKTATDMRPDYIQGYINRGDVLIKLGRRDEAIKMYETALFYEPENADVHYNLGVVCMEDGERQRASNYFENAIKFEPDHWQSLYNSAVMIQEDRNTERWPVAVERLQHLIKINKTDSRAPFSLAMLAMDMGDFIAAEQYFKKSVEIEPTFRSGLFNTALMLTNNLKRPRDAVPYLKQLLEHHPDHTKGMMLWGEINVNVLRDLDEADKSFRKVIELEPNNIEAMHNLCVVFVEKGYLLEAEKCLAHVHKVSPNEEYILNHLNLVRAKIKEYMDKQKAAKEDKSAEPGQGQDSQKPSESQDGQNLGKNHDSEKLGETEEDQKLGENQESQKLGES